MVLARSTIVYLLLDTHSRQQRAHTMSEGKDAGGGAAAAASAVPRLDQAELTGCIIYLTRHHDL